jgi:hypothetical protein
MVTCECGRWRANLNLEVMTDIVWKWHKCEVPTASSYAEFGGRAEDIYAGRLFRILTQSGSRTRFIQN